MSAALALTSVWLPAARAADRIYWENYGGGLWYTNLDGSGGGQQLDTTGAPMVVPSGLTIDDTTGRILWTNYSTSGSIGFANLDGSGGGGTFNGGGSLNSPDGLAIDPTTGRLYWGLSLSGTIVYARVDGTGGGGTLDTSGTPGIQANSMVADSATGRIYFTSATGNGIYYAMLDGAAGGGALSTNGVTPSAPNGIAIDAATGRIYWASRSDDKIEYANLDGSGGGGVLNTTGAMPNQPLGLALNPDAGKVYWVNAAGNTISYANLDGSGGGLVGAAGATLNSPEYPVLLEAPRATGAPAISGGSTTGSALTCGQGSLVWKPNLPEAQLWRAPHSFGYQWTLNGAAIAGATSSSYTALQDGSYGCEVLAANVAGTTSVASAPHAIGTTSAGAGNPPVISAASESHRRWARGTKLPAVARAQRAPVGTTFSVTVDENVRLTFTFLEQLPGRAVGGRCVALTHANQAKPKCVRSVGKGSFSFTGHAGLNRLLFQGRISAQRRLAVGNYRVAVVAANSSGRSGARTLSFTIVA